MKVFINILFFIYCFLYTSFLIFLVLIVNADALIGLEKYNVHIFLHTLISLFVVVILWLLLFLKINTLVKLMIYIIFIGYLFLFNTNPYIIEVYEYNTCIDTGICKDGIQTKIDGVLMKVNKENCLKYHKEWYDSINSCNIR